MKKNLIAGLSRIVDSKVLDSNKRLDEYILGSLRKNGLESLANIEEHEDGIRVSLQGYPFAYVDIYLDGEKVVADYSRNAQTIYPGTVKKYAEFAGIPEEQAQKEVKKFYNWMHVMKDHTGGLVDDIQKLKVEDSLIESDVFIESDGEFLKVYLDRKKDGVVYLTVDEDGDALSTQDLEGSKVVFENNMDGGFEKVVNYTKRPDGSILLKTEHVQSIKDCSGATTSADVDAGIPGKAKPVEDSRQDEVISYSWDEFEQKLNDYKELNAHSVVIGDKTYILSGSAVEGSDNVEDSEPIQDDSNKTYTVYRVGGSLGESYDFVVKGRRAHKVESGLSLEEAKEIAKYGNSKLSKGEKSYYGMRYSYIPDDKVTDSLDYRIEDDREYTKQQLIDRPPLWIKDKDIWEKAVDKVTHGGEKLTTVVVPIIVYKKMGGTKALNKKERAEREAADEKRMQAETSREGIEDSFFRKIQAGDTLRIVRGDHVGEFGEVLEVKEDGSFRLRNLKTDEEFEEPASMFGVFVTVTDSEITDAEDPVSLRQALATILKETDPKLRKRSIQSKVLSFLNAYGMDAEIESNGRIWLNDDDTSVKVDESTVSIKKGGESETEDYALLEDVEKWYNRIKELSDK